MAKLLFEPIILFAALCSIGFFFGVRAPVAQASTLAAAATAQRPAESPAEDHPSKRRFHGSFARLERLLRRYGYWAAGGATLAEGIGIPLPGQTLLIAGGVEAAEGRMSIAVLLLIVATTATLGNSLGYLIGYWGGRFVLSKLKVDPERQRHLQELFKRRGGLVILFARFIDGLRQLNGIVSGTMKMPWWTFTA